MGSSEGSFVIIMRYLLKSAILQKIDARTKEIFLETTYFISKCRGRVTCPDQPMLGEAEYKTLKLIAGESKRFIEYGSGGSTKFISENTRELITVESDRVFLDAVIETNRNNSNITFLYADLGPTVSFGQPIRSLKPIFKNRWSSYAKTPWSFLQENSVVDSIFIDGRFRVHCFLESLLCNHAENYSILVDDYFKRSEYFVVEEVAASPERIGDAALFRIARSEIDQKLVLNLVERYKCDFN